ncbi:MAG: cytochrome-c peroxidase, partial [Bacteroidota bacterium]
DDFSAFYFTRDYLNPLSESLRDFHQNSGLHFRASVPRLSSLNYSAAGLYDSTLIRPHEFAPWWAREPNDKLASVGRLLFYDPILSLNNQRACGSCHDPAKGFSDGHRQALGFDKQPTELRNTPTMLNAALSRAYRYDLAARFLDEQSPKVFQNHQEFRMTRDSLEKRLNQSPGYLALFSEALGKPVDKIDVPLMNTALAEYIRTLVALNSPFDQMIRGEIEPDSNVVAGYDLFMGKAACGTCHFPPVFNGLVPPYFVENESEIIGVPTEDGVAELSPDLGRYNYMKAQAYRHAFKTTSVRNSALTMPYMHNGSFETLMDVVVFYNQGGGRGRGYEVPGQTLDAEPLALTQNEMQALVSFMEALTDTTGHTSLPDTLPGFPRQTDWNDRPIGGVY